MHNHHKKKQFQKERIRKVKWFAEEILSKPERNKNKNQIKIDVEPLKKDISSECRKRRKMKKKQSDDECQEVGTFNNQRNA